MMLIWTAFEQEKSSIDNIAFMFFLLIMEKKLFKGSGERQNNSQTECQVRLDKL